MPGKDDVFDTPEDLHEISDADRARLAGLKWIKNNADLIASLVELESANNRVEDPNSTWAETRDEAARKAANHLLEVALDIIKNEVEQTPLHTLAGQIQGGVLSPHEGLEAIIAYLSEPEERQQDLPPRLLDSPKAIRHWEEITNDIATRMLAGSEANPERLAMMLDEIAEHSEPRHNIDPRKSFIQGLIRQYAYEENKDKLPSAGELIVWARQNHPEAIFDSMGESNDSIVQMILNLRNSLGEIPGFKSAVSAARSHGGGYPDVSEETPIPNTANTDLQPSAKSGKRH